MLNTSPTALRVHQRIAEGARDVADMDEVAALLAVLEDHRPLAVASREEKIASTPV